MSEHLYDESLSHSANCGACNTKLVALNVADIEQVYQDDDGKPVIRFEGKLLAEQIKQAQEAEPK